MQAPYSRDRAYWRGPTCEALRQTCRAPPALRAPLRRRRLPGGGPVRRVGVKVRVSMTGDGGRREDERVRGRGLGICFASRLLEEELCVAVAANGRPKWQNACDFGRINDNDKARSNSRILFVDGTPGSYV